MTEYRELAAAVLKQALFDARRGSFTARRFFTGGNDFRFWCACAGLDPEIVSALVRKQITGGSRRNQADAM